MARITPSTSTLATSGSERSWSSFGSARSPVTMPWRTGALHVDAAQSRRTQLAQQRLARGVQVTGRLASQEFLRLGVENGVNLHAHNY